MNTGGAQRTYWVRALGLSVAILLVTIGHLLTPVDRQVQHDILVRLYYIPIALGGLWYGLWGGLGTAGLITLVYLPHVISVDHGGMASGYLREIPVFLAVGVLIGLMVDRQEHYRRGLEVQAETLARSHRELQEQTRPLLEKEIGRAQD